MGIKNRPRAVKEILSNPSNSTDVIILKQMFEEIQRVVNNQADLMRKLNNRIGELQFKITKLDEQVHLNKLGLREEKDKNMVNLRTMFELGILEADIFNLAQALTQNKILPLNNNGDTSSQIKLSRYNCHPDMPKPYRGESN